jgi:hypothetical protein
LKLSLLLVVDAVVGTKADADVDAVDDIVVVVGGVVAAAAVVCVFEVVVVGFYPQGEVEVKAVVVVSR